MQIYYNLIYFWPKVKTVLTIEFFRNYIGNVVNKGLHREGRNKFSKNSYLKLELNMGPLVSYTDSFLFELTRHVLIREYLILLLVMHQLAFELRWFS